MTAEFESIVSQYVDSFVRQDCEVLVVVLVVRRISLDHWLPALNKLFMAGLVVIGAARYLAILSTISPEFRPTIYRYLPNDSVVERAR